MWQLHTEIYYTSDMFDIRWPLRSTYANSTVRSCRGQAWARIKWDSTWRLVASQIMSTSLRTGTGHADGGVVTHGESMRRFAQVSWVMGVPPVLIYFRLGHLGRAPWNKPSSDLGYPPHFQETSSYQPSWRSTTSVEIDCFNWPRRTWETLGPDLSRSGDPGRTVGWAVGLTKLWCQKVLTAEIYRYLWWTLVFIIILVGSAGSYFSIFLEVLVAGCYTAAYLVMSS